MKKNLPFNSILIIVGISILVLLLIFNIYFVYGKNYGKNKDNPKNTIPSNATNSNNLNRIPSNSDPCIINISHNTKFNNSEDFGIINNNISITTTDIGDVHIKGKNTEILSDENMTTHDKSDNNNNNNISNSSNQFIKKGIMDKSDNNNNNNNIPIPSTKSKNSLSSVSKGYLSKEDIPSTKDITDYIIDTDKMNNPSEIQNGNNNINSINDINLYNNNNINNNSNGNNNTDNNNANNNDINDINVLPPSYNEVMDEILNECIISSLNSASAPPNANYNT